MARENFLSSLLFPLFLLLPHPLSYISLCFPFFFARWDQSSFHRLFSFLLLNVRDMLWQVGCFVAVKGWLFRPTVCLSPSSSTAVVSALCYVLGSRVAGICDFQTAKRSLFTNSSPPLLHIGTEFVLFIMLKTWHFLSLEILFLECCFFELEIIFFYSFINWVVNTWGIILAESYVISHKDS